LPLLPLAFIFIADYYDIIDWWLRWYYWLADTHYYFIIDADTPLLLHIDAIIIDIIIDIDIIDII
jgi:hypothetical protein